uniref:Uncharacterized protein n=1 Tax=Zea mays TaxID=4577 RepID=A0A804PAK0_MAIZE
MVTAGNGASVCDATTTSCCGAGDGACSTGGSWAGSSGIVPGSRPVQGSDPSAPLDMSGPPDPTQHLPLLCGSSSTTSRGRDECHFGVGGRVTEHLLLLVSAQYRDGEGKEAVGAAADGEIRWGRVGWAADGVDWG